MMRYHEEFSLRTWTKKMKAFLFGRSNIHPSCQVLLKDNLTEDNFQRILAVIWESSAQVTGTKHIKWQNSFHVFVSQTLEETIYLCIENKKPPTYFKTLLETLKVLCDFFYGDLTPRDETLTR